MCFFGTRSEFRVQGSLERQLPEEESNDEKVWAKLWAEGSESNPECIRKKHANLRTAPIKLDFFP